MTQEKDRKNIPDNSFYPILGEFEGIGSYVRQLAEWVYLERIRNKSFRVLRRLENRLKPQGFYDRIFYMFDDLRIGRHVAVLTVLKMKKGHSDLVKRID